MANQLPEDYRRCRKLAIFFVATLLSGCSPAPDTPMQTTSPADHNEPEMKPAVGARFSITRVGVFQDSLAYSGKRGIYVVVDKQTGKEYLGISGVGVSEIGHHGKGGEDER